MSPLSEQGGSCEDTSARPDRHLDRGLFWIACTRRIFGGDRSSISDRAAAIGATCDGISFAGRRCVGTVTAGDQSAG
jgi:hypothetical protein